MFSIVANITDINFDDIKKKSLIIYNYDILIIKENKCIPLINKSVCKNYKSYKFYSYNFDFGLFSVSSKKTPVNNDYFPSTANSILEPVQMQSDSNNKPQNEPWERRPIVKKGCANLANTCSVYFNFSSLILIIIHKTRL